MERIQRSDAMEFICATLLVPTLHWLHTMQQWHCSCSFLIFLIIFLIATNHILPSSCY